MNKIDRFNSMRKRNFPDCMPVWPRAMSQIIQGMDWSLSEVVGTDWYDSDKCAAAVLWSLKNVDYDVVLPAYIDHTFGVLAAGGQLSKTFGFSNSNCFTVGKPIKDTCDWIRVQRKLARASARRSDPRMGGALETIRNVANSVGNTTPLVATGYLGATAAMLLFRSNEQFVSDMINRAEFALEMCRTATDWTLDWIRAQYEAGANSVTFLIDTMGTMMISPLMGERFNLPFLAEMVDTIRKDFDQGVWLHIHGNMKTAMGYNYLQKIVEQTGVEGVHLDDSHSPRWVKENVIDRLNIPACISLDCHKIAAGPMAAIESMVQKALDTIDDGRGVMMAPCCQILPHTPNAHFKAWVDATHTRGAYPLQSAMK
jgi:uroporphyrinogen-III decarboxylase